MTQTQGHAEEARRLEAIGARVGADGPEAVPLLISALEDSSWRVRQAAVHELARRQGADVVNALLRVMRDSHRDLGALKRLGGWKSERMVMRYAHVNVEELADTINRLPGGISGEDTDPNRRNA